MEHFSRRARPVARSRSSVAVRASGPLPIRRSPSLQTNVEMVNRRLQIPDTSVTHKMFEGPDRTVTRDLWCSSKYRPQWFRGERSETYRSQFGRREAANSYESYDPFYYLSPSWSCYNYSQPARYNGESPYHLAKYTPAVSYFPRYKWSNLELSDPLSFRKQEGWHEFGREHRKIHEFPYRPWAIENEDNRRAKDMYRTGQITYGTLDKYFLRSDAYRHTERWKKWHSPLGYAGSNRLHYQYL